MIRWLCDKPKYLNMDAVHSHLADSLRGNHLANGGPCAKKLEHVLRDLLEIGSDKALFVASSGTAALHALTGALCMEHGELRFATQSYTFPSTVVQLLRSSLVVDIDEGGGPDLALVPDDIDVLIVTNSFGHVVEYQRYLDWAEAKRKLLLFDNASTPATYYNGVNSLNLGTGSAISLHHTKPIGFGEGGAVIVDRKYENAVKRCMNYGYDVQKGDLVYSAYGSNYKLPDTSAAFILAYLERYSWIREKHETLYASFARKLRDLSGVRLFPSAVEAHFTSCLPVVFDKPVNTRAFVEKGIHAHKYYKPLRPTPVASAFYERVICLPLHVDLTEKDLDAYITAVAAIAQD